MTGVPEQSVSAVAGAVNVVARALIPIVGVLFLGWSGTRLLAIYFADTAASLYMLLALVTWVMQGEHADAVRSSASGRLRSWLRVIAMPLPALAILGFFFGILPLFVMLDSQDVSWGEFLRDPQLWHGVALQFVLALVLMLQQLAWIRAVPDRNGYLRFQLACLGARWGAMVLVGFFLLPYIPRVVYGPLLVAVYAAMTAALELAPGRVLAWIGRRIG
jgi:hypothetical protein